MYDTIGQVIEANRDSSAPHWFSPSSMAFFDTRLETVEVIAGRYFVTSEQPPGGARSYSVREAHDDGTIGTVGEFGEHPTLAEAVAAAEAL